MKKLDLSKLKPKPKADSAPKRRELNVPQPIEDLYRDLRDRRLLLPLVVLLAAIVAVPVALSASKEDPPPPLPVATPEGAEAVSPAVLAEGEVGVRDYRERLDELKSKNPFGNFKVSPKDVAESTSLDEPAPADSPSSTPDVTIPDDVGAPQVVEPADPGDQPSTGDDSTKEPKKQIVVMAPRLDVVAGPSGKTREIRNARIMDRLPAKKKAPIVTFIGVSDNLRVAHFAVSRDVTKTKGEGACRPRNTCEFLKLAVGKKRIFIYEGKRYSLRVTGLREVVQERRAVK